MYLSEYGVSAPSNDFSLFNISSCGFTRDEFEEKRFGTADYLILYVLKGSGEFTSNHRTHNLSAGDFIVCRPHEIKKFLPLEDTSCEYYWFSFSGKYSSDVLSHLNLTAKNKYFVGYDNEINLSFDKIIEEKQKAQANYLIICSALLVNLLGILSRLSIHIRPQDNAKGADKIAPALDAINSDCTSKIGVDEYAKMCNLSTSYFTHLFTKITGFSPMEYKQLQRITIAKNLLSTTTLSIKEISTVIGFKDPLYFGRCFKQATGKTPTSYRAKK